MMKPLLIGLAVLFPIAVLSGCISEEESILREKRVISDCQEACMEISAIYDHYDACESFWDFPSCVTCVCDKWGFNSSPHPVYESSVNLRYNWSD
jgi:hypothetical protein